MEPATVTVDNTDDLSLWAADVAENLSPQEDYATIIGLVGPLGVGKTAFVQALLSAYGVEGPITSPTYTIETVYQLPDGPFDWAYHLDAYRLDGAADLEALDFSRRLGDPKNLILIEWAGTVSELLPDNTLHIDISFADDDSEGRVMKIFYE